MRRGRLGALGVQCHVSSHDCLGLFAGKKKQVGAKLRFEHAGGRDKIEDMLYREGVLGHADNTDRAVLREFPNNLPEKSSVRGTKRNLHIPQSLIL